MISSKIKCRWQNWYFYFESATQELHKIIIKQKNETNDLYTRLARLEATIFSWIVDGTTNNGTDAYKNKRI